MKLEDMTNKDLIREVRHRNKRVSDLQSELDTANNQLKAVDHAAKEIIEIEKHTQQGILELQADNERKDKEIEALKAQVRTRNNELQADRVESRRATLGDITEAIEEVKILDNLDHVAIAIDRILTAINKRIERK